MSVAKISLESQIMLRSEMESMGLSYTILQPDDVIVSGYNGRLKIYDKYTPVLGKEVMQETESKKYFLLGADGMPLKELKSYEVYHETNLDNSLYGLLEYEQYVNLDVFWPLWGKPFQVDKILPAGLWR